MSAADGNHEITAPVRSEIHVCPALYGRHVEAPPLDQLKGSLVGPHPVGVADPVERVRPDPPPGHARRPFQRHHSRDPGSIVGEAVDPRHAAAQHLPLDPLIALAVEMRQEPAVTIDPPPAEGKTNRFLENKSGQHAFRFFSERPGLEVPAPEWEFGCLDADQPNLPAIRETHRVAVDDFGDDDPIRRHLGIGVTGIGCGKNERGDKYERGRAQFPAMSARTDETRAHGDTMTRQTLFPEIEPYETGRLAVDGIHDLYWEQCGKPDGVPVLFLHGGPGAGAVPTHRRFYDPRHYRIVIFDQRGAGRSTPLGELHDNTTDHLVGDIEKLRGHLGIERWFVFGGSWGSSLALAYGEAHPAHCLGLILRGVFLCRRDEIEWFMTGMRRIFPEAWAAFARHLPESERGDLLANYYRRLIDPDPNIHMPAARAWSRYEGSCSTLRPNPETVSTFMEPGTALGLARLEAHYFINDCFMAEGALLDNAGRLAEVPGVIIQGRYDVICPIESAAALAEAWSAAAFRVVPDAGHSAMEPGIRAGLIEAMEFFKNGV